MYSRANGPELWVLLLEKAFAKVHGSYLAIKRGLAYEALMDLTGAYMYMYTHLHTYICLLYLYAYICMYCAMFCFNYMMCVFVF